LACAVIARRGKPDNHSISRTDAWDYVNKLLFPDHELVKTYPRDRWLMDRYRPPNDSGLRHQPASLLPGGITYISGMVSRGTGFAPVTGTPKELIAEVDQAYFRQSLREDVHRWFARRDFDPKQRTIPKHLFDAAVQVDFGRLPPEHVKSIEKGATKAKPRKRKQPYMHKRFPKDDALVEEAIEGLGEKYSNKWQAALALAPRAEGSDQGDGVRPPAKVFRLNKKIGKALKAQNNSKRLKTNR